jgi:hypothetical protein
MANPFPFVAGDVLTAAELNGIGEVGTLFTPTITNGVLGNGTLSATYQRVNKIVVATYVWTLGSTSTITGGLQFSFPFTATSSTNMPIQILGGALFTDVSAGADFVIIPYHATTANVGFLTSVASTAFTTVGLVNATAPVAFGTGDVVRARIIYEAA